MKRFILSREVLPEHIDELGHVNNVQYLYWVQEDAHIHWKELTKNTKETLGVWVVRSHSITYKQPAYVGEFLTLQTFVNGSRGVLSERIVEIYNADKKLVAQCSTQWCYLNPVTGQAQKIPRIIIDLFEN